MCRTVIFPALLLSLGFAGQAAAQTLWTEDAENGLADVIDGTDSSYALIQSDFVSQGSNAFHLANPNFQDNWFVLDQDITIQSNTKLFFQSRLSRAFPGQLAKVQISTDNGASWPSDIYTQPGSGDLGEGAFGLRQVDLSPYASQDARFRFMFDFTGGSIFVPQNQSDIGWSIDDIQIGSAFSKSQYSIGEPSAAAQLYLELVNRARADAIVEANRLADATNPDIVSYYNFFGIDTEDIVAHFQWHVDNGHMARHAQPLAFNADLNKAAEMHTQDMFANQFQAHTSSANPPPPFLAGDDLGQRATALGYSWIGLAENIFTRADSVEHGHAGFEVDWGNTTDTSDSAYNPAFAGQGMQNPPGHRRNIHNEYFKEVGIGVINGTNGSVGPQLVTQDFGTPGAATFVTGVVFEDLDGDDFYDIGEGRAGVRVDVEGSGFFAISSDSGGYSVPVTGDGSYEVMFSGAGFADFTTTAAVVGGDNVKIDYLAATASFDPADFNEDGYVDGLDLTQWRGDFGLDGGSDADSDNDSDGADFFAWQRAFAAAPGLAAVPEPATAALALLGIAALSGCRLRLVFIV